MPDPVFVSLTPEQFAGLVGQKQQGGSAPPFFSTLGRPEYDLNMKDLVDIYIHKNNAQAQFPSPWEQLAQNTANFANLHSQRILTQGADFDKAVNAGIVLSGQIGVAQGQAAVPMTQAPIGPIRTAAGDATVQMPPGAAYPPNRQSDQMGAVASGAVDVAAAATGVAASATATDNLLALQGSLQSMQTALTTIAALMPKLVSSAAPAQPSTTTTKGVSF